MIDEEMLNDDQILWHMGVSIYMYMLICRITGVALSRNGNYRTQYEQSGCNHHALIARGEQVELALESGLAAEV
jgi:hypothetical protein